MCRHGDARCSGGVGSVLEHVCPSCLDDVAVSEDGDLRYRSGLVCMCDSCNPSKTLPPDPRPTPLPTMLFGGEPEEPDEVPFT